MEERSRFINPKRMGIWVVVGVGTALLALILAFEGMREARLSAVVAQAEVLNLNKRVQTLERERAAPLPAPASTPAPAK